MTEVKNPTSPERCLYCNSRNIIGPYKYIDSGVRLSGLLLVRQKAFVCVDCGYTMLFTRGEQEERILKESLRIQSENE